MCMVQGWQGLLTPLCITCMHTWSPKVKISHMTTIYIVTLGRTNAHVHVVSNTSAQHGLISVFPKVLLFYWCHCISYNDHEPWPTWSTLLCWPLAEKASLIWIVDGLPSLLLTNAVIDGEGLLALLHRLCTNHAASLAHIYLPYQSIRKIPLPVSYLLICDCYSAS